MAWKGGFEGNTKMPYLCRYKYFVGMFWGCTLNNTGNGNFHSDDDEPKGNGALDVHLNLVVMAYL
jgi:hypothetical protein